MNILRTHIVVAVVALIVGLSFVSPFAHAGTRVTDERFAGSVVAPTGAAGLATVAAGVAGFYVGGAIWNLQEPAGAESFVDFRNYGFTPLASYYFGYTTTSEEQGELDCSLTPTPGAAFTCAVPEGTNQIAVYVFEDGLAEVTGALWHVE